MLTGPQLYNAAVGETVRLSCEFRASTFNLFNNPLLWIKTQKGEDTQVNIQSNINQPFRSTNRFKVKYIPMEPIYRFELTIIELQRADNGNYTCEIRAENSRVLANVTHLVIVRAPVESMFVSDKNDTADTSPSELVYKSTEPATLRCLAAGAYPAPDLQLSVDNMDVGSRLAWKYKPLFHGPKGLRRMSYTVERWSHHFVARPEYDGKDLLCAALVPGLTVHTTTVKIRVEYQQDQTAKSTQPPQISTCRPMTTLPGHVSNQRNLTETQPDPTRPEDAILSGYNSDPPIIRCHDVTALLGQRNVSLTCTVTSRPRVTGIRWFIDMNGTHFDVLLSTAFWASQKVLNSTSLQATLHLSHIGRRRFRTYNILAKNQVGESVHEVQLIRNYAVPTPTQPPNDLTTMKTARYGESGSHYIFIISGAPSTHAPISSTFHRWAPALLCTLLSASYCLNVMTIIHRITAWGR